MTTSSRGEAAAAPESQGQTSWRLRLGKKNGGKKTDSYNLDVYKK
jgi:hypothetical protein